MERAGSPLVIDSVARLGPEAAGRVALSGSHAGRFAAWLCARAGLRGVVLSDAGIGRERAGIAGLDELDSIAVPAAAVSHLSARIGDAADLLARGIVSEANAAARACGVSPGMAARDALARLDAEAPGGPAAQLATLREARHEVVVPGGQVLALDSNSLVTAADAGAIVFTGSHGGLLGGRPESAVKADVFAALYNDAGIGIDEAGVSRLPALDARGIAGATVDAFSARIGEGLSTLQDGVLSRVNATARRLGLREGMSAREAAERLASAISMRSPA